LNAKRAKTNHIPSKQDDLHGRGGNRLRIPIKYESEVITVPFGKGTIQIENLTPILSPRDREKRKREVETRLFDVFSKYGNGNP